MVWKTTTPAPAGGHKHRLFKYFGASFSLLISGLLSGCLSSTGDITSQTGSVTTTTSTSTGSAARAAKIVFKASNPGGSFDSPTTSNGTVPTPGSGHPAKRVFNADGSLLATSTSDTNWPKWLTSVEIGLSGSSNTSATHSDCARFGATGEDTGTVCDFDADGTADKTCGVAGGLYRVSEYDCARGTTMADGNGGPSDGVYIRASFSRNTAYLGASENILAVLEYASSGLNAAPANPTACFTGGVFTPSATGCSDQNWNIYLKHSTSEVVQPYLMLTPPSLATVDFTNNRGGSGVSTKQFFIPLAGDSALNTVQFSRIKALPKTAPQFQAVCHPTNTTAASNSALCVGMVFYSITFFRI